MKSMEKIVNLIRDNSSRVNILALNATIEAARAGRRVRASRWWRTEVKSLSNQTAEATDQIAKEIAAVQTISGSVATGIQGTVTGIREVSEYINSVAVAMEEQTAVTRENIREHDADLAGGAADHRQKPSGGTSKRNNKPQPRGPCALAAAIPFPLAAFSSHSRISNDRDSHFAHPKFVER